MIEMMSDDEKFYVQIYEMHCVLKYTNVVNETLVKSQNAVVKTFGGFADLTLIRVMENVERKITPSQNRVLDVIVGGSVFSEAIINCRARFQRTRYALDFKVKIEAIHMLMDNLSSSFCVESVALKCWYFNQIWKIILLIDDENFLNWEKIVEEYIAKYEPRVKKFVKLVAVMKPRYSREELQKLFTSGTNIISPIASIVYDYLIPASAETIQQEILSLVKV